jgi:hypothetical protein
MPIQQYARSADIPQMAPTTFPESFCLYLWRSPDLPGTLYLAQGFETAETLCKELTEDGYIVKVIHAATNAEFELSAGRLRPPRVQQSPATLR